MEVEHLQRRLEESFRSSPYHSFLGSLQGVTDDEARWIPTHYRGYPHMTGTILNLAYHVAGDRFVLVSTAFGDGLVTWKKMQARFESYGGDLAAAIRLAEEGHRLVLETLTGLTDADLPVSHPYYGGKTHTAEELFHIIIEHDVYHAGQIRYVRNLYAGGKKEKS